jgi:hypothetical protein
VEYLQTAHQVRGVLGEDLMGSKLPTDDSVGRLPYPGSISGVTVGLCTPPTRCPRMAMVKHHGPLRVMDGNTSL